MMENKQQFQGVVCCCINLVGSFEDKIIKLLDLKTSSIQEKIKCFELDLSNKYYEATIHLFDYSTLSADQKTQHLFDECHAVILIVNGLKITTEQLDNISKQLADVKGEPRILLSEDTNEDLGCPKSIQDWCIQNSYDQIDVSAEDAKTQLIDSLSAYRWKYRRSPNGNHATSNTASKPELNDELMQKLADFDTLLGKLSAYRDQPELRGDSNDKNILEIAEILSGLLGDDMDDFLVEESNDEQTNDTLPEEKCPSINGKGDSS